MLSDTRGFSAQQIFRCCTQVLMHHFEDGVVFGLKLRRGECEQLSIGAKAFITFRAGTTGRSGGLFAKAFHFISLNREEYLNHYHKRSNAESTFSTMKAKFGDYVRSKTDMAMKNEVLCKILTHNICCLISAIYVLGLQPVFQKMIGTSSVRAVEA